MKRMIPADRLGRPDNFITMSVEKMRTIRAEQGLTEVIVTLDEEALRVRLHTQAARVPAASIACSIPD